jgi:hypothetical protein
MKTIEFKTFGDLIAQSEIRPYNLEHRQAFASEIHGAALQFLDSPTLPIAAYCSFPLSHNLAEASSEVVADWWVSFVLWLSDLPPEVCAELVSSPVI